MPHRIVPNEAKFRQPPESIRLNVVLERDHHHHHIQKEEKKRINGKAISISYPLASRTPFKIIQLFNWSMGTLWYIR